MKPKKPKQEVRRKTKTSPKDIGKRVRILSCEHYDAKAGMVGVITDTFANGYGVEIKGHFRNNVKVLTVFVELKDAKFTRAKIT